MTAPARPLSGWRVLVPRGGKWGDSVAARVRGLGGIPVIAPVINFASIDDAAPLTQALARLAGGHYDWLVVTSATTVDVLVSQGATIPESTRVAAVGETTALALTLAGYAVHFVPEGDNSARGLLKEWPLEASGLVLVPQSDIAEPTLVAGLAERGFDAEFVAAYRTIGVPVAESVRQDAASGRIRAILITSGSVARQVAEQLSPLPEGTVIVCIGPRTAYDTRAAGLAVHAISETRSADALVDALAEYAASTEGSK